MTRGELPASQPSIVELTLTLNIQGQDGRYVWDQFSSDKGVTEPFVGAISSDGRTLVGSDSDGSYFATVLSADLLDVCYTLSGVSPSKSIAANCYRITRKR